MAITALNSAATGLRALSTRIDVVATRDVDAMGGGIDQQIVPPAIVGQFPLIEDLVGPLCAGRSDGGKRAKKNGGKEGMREGSRGGSTMHGVSIQAGKAKATGERIVSWRH